MAKNTNDTAVVVPVTAESAENAVDAESAEPTTPVVVKTALQIAIEEAKARAAAENAHLAALLEEERLEATRPAYEAWRKAFEPLEVAYNESKRLRDLAYAEHVAPLDAIMERDYEAMSIEASKNPRAVKTPAPKQRAAREKNESATADSRGGPVDNLFTLVVPDGVDRLTFNHPAFADMTRFEVRARRTDARYFLKKKLLAVLGDAISEEVATYIAKNSTLLEA